QGTFKEEFILFSVRLPRMVITLLAGMALALSGAVLQGITRNDLADPGIVGINAGAGVAIAVFFLFFPVKADTFVFALP
ncbi:iron ABC transporter permease, partial [Anoxybacillus sp. LAT_38]|nr:iron ABC transporter permease [Anoxybacillus sp. LAT_38]